MHHSNEHAGRVPRAPARRRRQDEGFRARPPAPAADRTARSDEPLLFEPRQRRVDRADGDLAAGPAGDFLPDRHPVRLRSEVRQRQHYVDLEFAKEIAFGVVFAEWLTAPFTGAPDLAISRWHVELWKTRPTSRPPFPISVAPTRRGIGSGSTTTVRLDSSSARSRHRRVARATGTRSGTPRDPLKGGTSSDISRPNSAWAKRPAG